MKAFEYEITTHSAETFKHITFFCTEEGQCSTEDIPEDQLKTLSTILNNRGALGWELIQMSFNKDGIMAFWKRKKKEGKPGKEEETAKAKEKSKK